MSSIGILASRLILFRRSVNALESTKVILVNYILAEIPSIIIRTTYYKFCSETNHGQSGNFFLIN